MNFDLSGEERGRRERERAVWKTREDKVKLLIAAVF